jgi:hypothetical protein
MSHTSIIKGIELRDARAIEQAVADLRAKGVEIELRINETPRMYYESQAREVGVCDYVLRLGKSRYDVALKRNPMTGTYDVFLDTWGGDIAGAIGATCPLPRDEYARAAEHAIGQFVQRYGVNVSKNQARQAGYEITEMVDESGTVHLMVAV